MATKTAYNMRNFYILSVTQILSLVGSGMTNLAIGLWIFSETGNTTPLLLVGFFFWLPRMLGGSLGGVLADRFSRKKLIILGDTGQAIPTFFLMISFFTGNFAVWQLYGAALIQALFGLVQGPAWGASIAMLVPENQRPRANAIQQTIGPMAGFLAPSLAGIFYALIGVAGVLAIDLTTFLLAVVVISRLTIPQPEKTEESQETEGSIWQELRGGWQFLMTRRGLFILSLYFTFLNFVTSGIWRLMPAYLLVLTDSEETVGLLLSVSSFGLVTGGFLTMIWQGTDPRIHTILPALGLAAVGLLVFGTVRTPLSIAITLFFMMLPYKMTNALLSSIQQVKIPPDMQGRVFALLSQISTFALPITYLITGPIVDEILEPMVGTSSWDAFAPIVGNEAGAGMGLYIIICGILLLVGTVVVYSLPIVRNLEHDLPNYKAVAQTEADLHDASTELEPLPA